MELIDTHTHIYLDDFNEDVDGVIRRAKEIGINKMLLPNIDQQSIEAMLHLEKTYPNICYPMMGLHPTSVKEDYLDELEIVKKWLDKHKFYAVGEIGIDLYWDKTFVKEQMDAFKIQIQWAKEHQLPIVIHARESFDEIFSVMDECVDQSIKGVFHSFGGSFDQAQKALSYPGFKLGINGVVTFKNSGLDKVIKQIPLSDLVLETDAPYLSPTPYRGKRNEPSYLAYVGKKLSEIYDVSQETVAEVTTKSAENLFGF